MQRHFATCLAWLVISTSGASARPRQADLQFFGDVLLTSKALQQAQAKGGRPSVFADSLELLRSAGHNVVNLEGVISSTLPPLSWKQYFLRMPPQAAQVLRMAGVDAVTLANNHTMDYGFAGLLSTLAALAKAEISSVGAGINLTAASAPLIFDLGAQKVCLLAFSKTLPSSFWATSKRAGTAFAEEKLVAQSVGACRQRGYYTIVAIHWGKESERTPSTYQRDLAHWTIDAGANMVIGHHPHVVQDIEVYKDQLIFYSLGNFAFGTEPQGSDQQGLAVRLAFQEGQISSPSVEVIPLLVNNQLVRFIPRPITGNEPADLAEVLPSGNRCAWQGASWICAPKHAD